MNYGELKQAVEDWSKRSDLTAKIPTFLDLAHTRIVNDLDVPTERSYLELDNGTAITVTSNVHKLALPADYYRLDGLTVNGLTVDPMTPAQLTSRYRSGGGGVGKNYAIYGNDIWVAPGLGRIEVWYYSRLADLVADTDTNTVSDRYPQCYIYAALVHLHEYVQDMEMVSSSSQMYDAAAIMANEQMRLSQWSPTAMQKVE